MDQSSRKVVRFYLEMRFEDGTSKVVIRAEDQPEYTIFYRDTESHINGENGLPEQLYKERTLVWSKKVPWVSPEKQAMEEANARKELRDVGEEAGEPTIDHQELSEAAGIRAQQEG